MLNRVCSVTDHIWHQIRYEQKNETRGSAKCVSAVLTPLHHFDAFCDSLLYRRTAVRNPFVSYNIERLSPNPGQMTTQNQWKDARNLAFV